MIIRVLLLAVGYCFGLIANGVIVGKLNGVDIRSVGSGNIGATNTLRALGPKFGVLVLFLDFLKAFLPCMAVGMIFSASPLRYVYMMYTGLGVTLGHDFAFFLKFKGGKGVACGAGVVFALDWRLGIILVLIFTVITLISRIVSLGSITVMLCFIAACWCFSGLGTEFCILGTVLGLLSIARHWTNIKRLVKGTENKI